MPRTFRNGNDLANAIDRMSREFQENVKGIVEFNLGEIETEAIRNAPGPGENIATEHGPERQDKIARGRNWTPISQAIGYKIDPDGYSGNVYIEGSAGEIAIYVEFGCGQSARSYLATIPAEFREVAKKFYINGKGTIINKPYLLPAYFKYQIQFVKELKQAIKNMRL